MEDKYFWVYMNNEKEIKSQFLDQLRDGQEIEIYLKKQNRKDFFQSQIQSNSSFPTPQLDQKIEKQTYQESILNQNDQSSQEQMPLLIQLSTQIPLQVSAQIPQQVSSQIPIISQDPQPIKPKDHQPQFQGIFKKKNKKKIKIPKNTNVIKYFNKLFILRCTNKKYMRYFQNEPMILRQVKRFIMQQKRGYKTKKNWNHNIDSMIKIFGLRDDSSNPEQRSLIMRKIAHQMIYKEMIPEVLKNTKIDKKMKKCYIYTLTTLSHRCSNHLLMTRTQIA